MSDAMQLIIPYASAMAPACQEERQSLRLPALSRLLARLAPAGEDAGEDHDLSLPHERALARALDLPAQDGHTPWAAWARHESGQAAGSDAWAWLTPCHWVVGRDHVDMLPPAALGLDEAGSRALLEAMRPYFEEDGISLEWQAADRWLARGELFRELPCASLDRVSGRDVDSWLPRAPVARTVRRLQQEMQMLLYTHPANEARERQGLRPVNSFWVTGAGALPSPVADRRPEGLRLDERLRQPALAGDGEAWAQAWHELDAQVLAPLLPALDQGLQLTLTLCGERSARSWAAAPRGWGARLSTWLRPPQVATALETL